MTLSPLDKVTQACRKINLEYKKAGGNLWIYRPDGALLRTFHIYGVAVNADDFANWWRFMGYDK